MIEQLEYDVAVIGGGAAGLAAGAASASAGCRTLILDRNERAGGILEQCIHNGFGVRYFGEELSGPEYAARAEAIARKAGAEIRCASPVVDLKRLSGNDFELTLLSRQTGVSFCRARAVVLAAGCRERHRGNLGTPGSRPAGVMTAGTAQKLINIDGVLPGTRAVIVGSGDIGLIMARRLKWSGVEVSAVVELLDRPSGLPRNIAQCLEDFNIPLLLSHSVTGIRGRDRVEGVEIAPLVSGRPDETRKRSIECDLVLFSVGLLPINELILPLGAEIDPATGGAVADSFGQTTVPGVFAGGNVLHVHDLVDFVSAEAERAGKNAARYVKGELPGADSAVETDVGLRYVVPRKYQGGEETVFSFRPRVAAERAELTAELDGKTVFSRKMLHLNPAEMIEVKFAPASGKLIFHLRAAEEKR